MFEIISIFEKYNVNLVLYAGTLIGFLREKNYIKNPDAGDF